MAAHVERKEIVLTEIKNGKIMEKIMMDEYISDFQISDVKITKRY